MTQAEIVLQAFARHIGAPLRGCNIESANIGKPSHQRVQFKRRGSRVTVLAADNVLVVDVALDDGALLFAVNQPDCICLADDAVQDLDSILPWPVFADNEQGARLVAAWVLKTGGRPIRELALAPDEALFVFRNVVEFKARLNRDLLALVERLLTLAELLPRAEPDDAINLSVVPEDLRPLCALFDRWAVSDDDERAERVRQSNESQRRALVSAVEPLTRRIDEYLASFGDSPLPEEAIRLGQLAEATIEIRAAEA